MTGFILAMTKTVILNKTQKNIMIKKTISIFSIVLLTIVSSLLFSGCSKKPDKENTQIQTNLELNTFIKDWLIIGPFPNCETCSTVDYMHGEHCKGFYTDFLASIGGEKNAIPTDGMQVENSDKKWSVLHSAEDKIHFSEIFKPKDMVVGYAFSQIVSPEDQKLILSVGSNDGVRVFLNGEEVHQSHPLYGRWLQSDNDYVPVELKKGTNNLLLKIDQGVGDFGYVARFLDHDSIVSSIQKNIDQYKALKVVAISDTLVTSFGTRDKISILNPKGKVTIEMIHEKKGKLAEKMVEPGDDANFLLASVPDGFLNIKASFPTLNKGIIISETRYYKGKLKRHPRVARMTKDLTILNEKGESFFPIGTYGAPVEDYKKLKDAGYNFVVTGVDNLDKVHAAGLLAAVHVSGKTPQDFTDFISKYKDHPAILCWMLYDEPGYNKADLQFIYDIYNAAYKADQVHPSYLVITHNSVYKTFGPLCDVLAIDTYPIADGSIEDVGGNIALAYDQLDKIVPIWNCGQMFSWPNQRRPNAQEHRFMTYASIISGAKGTLWYTYKGYGQDLPVDDPELWEAQKILLSELNELAPLFLEPGFGKELQTLSKDKTMKTILKKSPIGTFIIASNNSKTETIQAEFKVKTKFDGKIPVYNENRKVEVKNGIIKDEFKPLDVHIYKLKTTK